MLTSYFLKCLWLSVPFNRCHTLFHNQNVNWVVAALQRAYHKTICVRRVALLLYFVGYRSWLILLDTFLCFPPIWHFKKKILCDRFPCFCRSTTAECVMGVYIHAQELSVCSSQMKRRSTSLDIRSTKEAAGLCVCLFVCCAKM